MVFDSADHAPAVAGVAALVAAVVPWSVSLSSDGFSGAVALRFVFGSVAFAFGARSDDVTRAVVPVTAVGSRSHGGLARLATLWRAGAALVAVALVVGVLLLLVGDRLTRGVFDPVRLVGLLLLCAALAFSGAAWLLFEATAGVPIPVGVAALYLFGGGLLRVERPRATRPADSTG